jgi:hypothetical protein
MMSDPTMLSHLDVSVECPRALCADMNYFVGRCFTQVPVCEFREWKDRRMAGHNRDTRSRDDLPPLVYVRVVRGQTDCDRPGHIWDTQAS